MKINLFFFLHLLMFDLLDERQTHLGAVCPSTAKSSQPSFHAF
jgi:hypothetical protein